MMEAKDQKRLEFVGFAFCILVVYIITFFFPI
jgi:hypothetical protein